ncbi:hypothetical protein OESDEN_11526 [Oesophagostomum dentatum]|uniref:Uncharacterized protein n=1 Tax=Oesophagostomum dentatum TaxID=61180 RepID=A0A0B1SZW4_OESDE|nr:hypothetical protein OESDEN_11526 [Oesophagostomum dentatum]
MELHQPQEHLDHRDLPDPLDHQEATDSLDSQEDPEPLDPRDQMEVLDSLEAMETQGDQENPETALNQESAVSAPSIAPSTVESTSRTELVVKYRLHSSNKFTRFSFYLTPHHNYALSCKYTSR